MSEPTKPTAPDKIPQYILDGLDRQGPETLQQIAAHAEDLAKWKKAKTEAELANADVVQEDSTDDELPDDVPEKANIVIKIINNNRYYYYQWRDGDQVKSKYKAPVSESE